MPSLTQRQPPRGWLRIAFRLPIWLYRGHLGWLLGHRFLMLDHRGRTSGKWYATVLEMVHYDPVTHRCIIASGYGESSDWFRNIQQTPEVMVTTGFWHGAAQAVRLSPEDAEQELQRYARRHPLAMRELVRFMTGQRFTGKPDEIAHLAQQIPLVALESLHA